MWAIFIYWKNEFCRQTRCSVHRGERATASLNYIYKKKKVVSLRPTSIFSRSLHCSLSVLNMRLGKFRVSAAAPAQEEKIINNHATKFNLIALANFNFLLLP
jgi:hypothetical protein